MDKRPVLGIISDFKKAVETNGIKVKKLILFGSYAKGGQKENSDIDLVVLSEDFKEKNYWERIDILSAAIYQVFKPIEAVAMTPQEWEKQDSLIFDYAKDGEVIYG